MLSPSQIEEFQNYFKPKALSGKTLPNPKTVMDGTEFYINNIKYTMRGGIWTTKNFGEMYQANSSTTITVDSANVAYKVTGYLSGHILGFKFVDNALVTPETGFYHISWNTSFTTSSANQDIEGYIGINGRVIPEGSSHVKIGTATDTRAFSGTSIDFLKQGDNVSFMVMNTTSSADVIIEHSSLIILQLGV